MAQIELYEVMLQEQLKVPAGWKVFCWNCSRDEVPEGFVKIIGSVPVGRYKSGPRKGGIKWGKRGEEPTESTHFINRVEFDAWCEQWEQRTGSCFSCFGTHQAVSSWSKADGHSYVPCKRCKDRIVPSVECEPAAMARV